MKAKVNKVTIEIVHKDILSLAVQVMVTVTDPNLTLSRALAAKAGADVERECRELGWCDVGAAVMTGAGQLPIAKLIHAVGPRWGEGSERGKLSNVTQQSLRLAEDHQLKSIALPAISTGPLGYPVENCAKTMLTQIIDFTFEELKHLRTIIVCLDSVLALQAFEREFRLQLQDLNKSGDVKVKV